MHRDRDRLYSTGINWPQSLSRQLFIPTICDWVNKIRNFRQLIPPCRCNNFPVCIIWDPCISPYVNIFACSRSSYIAVLERVHSCHNALPSKGGALFNIALIKSPLALRIVAHNDSGLSTRRHACFANKARLKQCISRKLIPPWSFGTHNFHHAIQCIIL